MRFIDRIKTFLEESRAEFRHVNWPTRAEALRLTGVVVSLSLALSLFLGAFDYLFSYLVRTFVLQV